MIDYLAQHLWQMWAVVAVVCLILELTAGDFFIICFSIGAVFGAIAAACGPFAKRYLRKGEDNRVSNAEALLGRQGRVVETVKADGFGRVQIDGDIWKAVTKESADIPEGTNVRVIARESTIITVESIK